MEQLTKNQAVATSQEAVQNQNEPQLRDENAHNDKSVHGVLNPTYQAGLRRRSEERFSRNAETDLVCRLLLEKKKYSTASFNDRQMPIRNGPRRDDGAYSLLKKVAAGSTLMLRTCCP